MTTQITYEPPIQSAIADHERCIASIKERNNHAVLAREFAEAFPDEHYHTLADSTSVDVSVRPKSGDKVLEMLRWFRERGFKSVGYEDKPSWNERIYDIREIGNTGDSWQHQIMLKAYFSAKDAECKYVEVGKKILPAIPEREEPVLELQCGGSAVPVEA